MIRPQIFERLIGGPGKSRGSDQKRVFRRNINPELLAVAYHVEDILRDHGSLSDHAHHRWALGQYESGHVVVVLDHAAIGRPGTGNQVHRGLNGLHGSGLFVVFGEQVLFIRFELRPDFFFLDVMPSLYGYAPRRQQGHEYQQ